MRLLHVIATPRGATSNTLRISAIFLSTLAQQRPDLTVDSLDLFRAELPSLSRENAATKYTLMHGDPLDRRHRASWRPIERLVSRFLAADAYLVSTPMWNLSIPYVLKYYLDCIVQPGYTFRYGADGAVEPLVLDRPMVCVTSRGGDYSAGGPMAALDFQEPYLRTIFGFIGITDLAFVSLQSTDIPPLRQAGFDTAVRVAREVACSPAWGGAALSTAVAS